MLPSRSAPLRVALVILLTYFFSILVHVSIAGDTIIPNKSIGDGETLISAGGAFELGFFSPGSSKNRYVGIWYKNIPIRTIVWVANRENPISDSTGNLGLTADGYLVLRSQSGDVVWSTGTSNASDPVVQLLDSGNLVLREGNSDIATWQSFDHPTDTLLPGMKLGWDAKTNLNRNITAWNNTDDPSPGPYSYKMDTQGLPEVLLWNRSTLVYRNGPWNGSGFSGFPEMKSNEYFTFSFISNSDEVYYTYQLTNDSVVSRLVMNQFGVVQRFVWLDGWSLYWWFPKDQCDEYAECGGYGVCDSDDSPVCKCLSGFEPKSAKDWSLRDGSQGCVRRRGLECGEGDGFLKVSGMKLPDTTNTSVDMSLGFDECRERCLMKCSCMAFTTSIGGCVTWGGDLMDLRGYTDGGQDLYVRLAASELDSIRGEESRKKKIEIVKIIASVVGVLLLVSVGLFVWKKKRKQGMINGCHSIESRETEMELPLFEIYTIASATDNFSAANKLGEGGFGPVYKGRLGDGQEIAVKRLSRNSLQGLDEFKNEVMVIAKLQHRNLVRLLGCCIQGEERMLMYEYMPNKSLDAFVFDKTRAPLLDWRKRLDIILGIARGLLYLHQDSRYKIIHRDLKASNILLDDDMNPKISDFGTARIFKIDQMQESTRRVVGTYGYMSPEYAMDGIFSVKSDVFSFGVLVLEILSGKKNRVVYQTEPYLNLLGHAWRLWKEGKCLELLDEAVECSCPMSEVLRCIQVGLLCVQEGCDDRPSMPLVVLMLCSESMQLPQPKRPGFCKGKTSMEKDWSSTSQNSSTINEVSITLFEGR